MSRSGLTSPMLRFLRNGLGKNQQALERFQREVWTAAALNNPNIVLDAIYLGTWAHPS